jgi:hypothetical protein
MVYWQRVVEPCTFWEIYNVGADMLNYIDLIEYLFTPKPIYHLDQTRNILLYIWDASGFGAKLDITPAIASYGNNIFKTFILSYTGIPDMLAYYEQYFITAHIFVPNYEYVSHNGCSSVGINNCIVH